MIGIRRWHAPLCSILVSIIVVGELKGAVAPSFAPDTANVVSFPAREAKFVRFVILEWSGSQPCLDELEVYAAGGEQNLALAERGGKATASSCLAGHAIHKIEHLNDGRYGNSHSWIAGGGANPWAQIELPEVARIAKVIFSRDRDKAYRDRMPVSIEVQLSLDGQRWETVSKLRAKNIVTQRVASYVPPIPLPQPATTEALVRYAFLCERVTWNRISPTDHLSPLVVDRPATPGGAPYWGHLARLDSLARTLLEFEELIERLAAKGIAVAAERAQLQQCRQRQAALPTGKQRDVAAEEALYLEARWAKRRAMFRDPDLAELTRILFVKRHPYRPSHNYSDILDSQFKSGGGVCVLDIPRVGDRFEPEQAQLTTLFDASQGIARDARADFAAQQVYFAYRPAESGLLGQDCFWHLMSVGMTGGPARQLTDGPFHDYYPCPLPDGGMAFVTTRCRSRFLCWRPQAFVLFRMNADAGDMHPLSFANLSEWAPTVMRDGRILWTRSEYLDKGADFGHTLWAIRPDGTHPQLVFGNDTPNCYMNGHEVPGTREMCCTLISHGGDLNGPIGLIDTAKGPFDSAAVTNITPDTTPHYNMNWARQECFRDPVPLSRDYFLVSHAAADLFGLYVIDRFGNRELLYLDPDLGSMCPTPLRSEPKPPVLRAFDPHQVAEAGLGVFTVADVYEGLGPEVQRGRVKYLRVCQEVRPELEQLPNGEYRKDHGPVFQDFYATPIHKIRGPAGWPSYVAKTALGLAPVEADGSANFYAPAGKVLYFQALDADFNELQRMRSVVQLQPGEQRSCVGCHDNRQSTPRARPGLASLRAPDHLQPPSWGAAPFSYEKVVQPVWDAQCVRCHDAADKQNFNLADTLDADKVPASYRTLIAGGWVHYFDYTYGLRHSKAAPLTFGTLQSKLWKVLEAGHYDVKLTHDEMHRIKCWIDLNCPLWPDYIERSLRPGPTTALTRVVKP